MNPGCPGEEDSQASSAFDGKQASEGTQNRQSEETHARSHTLSHTQGQPASETKFFLHNHLRFAILYHKDEATDLARIVGFEVEPFSVKHTWEAPWDDAGPTLNTCNPGRMVYVTHETAPQPVRLGEEVIFTYDVKFVVSGGCGRASKILI